MTRRPRKRLGAAERHQQLLECALLVAARTGLGRLVHAEVAREADVSVPAVFSYFPNRTTLVRSVLDEVARFYIELAKRWHRPEIIPLQAVLGHVREFSDSVESHAQYACIWLEWSAAVRNEEGTWDLFLEFQETVIKFVASSIRRAQRAGELDAAVNAPNAARLIVASAYTVAQLGFMRRSPRFVNRYIEQVVGSALQIPALEQAD